MLNKMILTMLKTGVLKNNIVLNGKHQIQSP
jgi:hypothetical protein